MSHDVIWLTFFDFNSISANIDRKVPHKDIIVQLSDSIIRFISQKRFQSVNDRLRNRIGSNNILIGKLANYISLQKQTKAQIVKVM